MRKFFWVILLPIFWLSCNKSNEQNYKTLRNLKYGSHNRQAMDVFLPANRNSLTTPVFIWIHGGAWSGGDKSEFSNLLPELEKRLSGFAYIALNYRLFQSNTGQNRFPAQEEDIRSAVEYILSKTHEWNISQRIVIAGASAGGHLALLESYKHNHENKIEAVVAYFPPTELIELHAANLYAGLVLSGALGGDPNQKSELYVNSSPVNFVSETSIPTIFFHGTADEVVPISQSILLKEKLEENQRMFQYKFYENEPHGFSIDNTFNSIDLVSDFLRNLGLH